MSEQALSAFTEGGGLHFKNLENIFIKKDGLKERQLGELPWATWHREHKESSKKLWEDRRISDF